ncbi:MAG: glycoside hydrolase family 3 C-terminal domain-containing protein [Elusimicrobiota bacterium]
MKTAFSALVLSLFFFTSTATAAGTMITPADIETITASSDMAGNLPRFAFDGDLATRWESQQGIDDSWIEFKFKKTQTIDSMKILWETASGKEYKIQTSKNGFDWKDAASVSEGREGEEKVIGFKQVETKFVRVLGIKRATAWGYSIFDVEFNSEDANLPPFDPKAAYLNPELSVDKRADDLVKRMSLSEKIALVSGSTGMSSRANSRLKIPVIEFTDGPHGVGWGQNTCFPTGISFAATWDPALIQRVGVALANETRGQGRNVLLGPCVNINRYPLGGRNFESYGEDPYLAGRIAVGYVKGIQSRKTGTSVKHYACNNQEWCRTTISAEVSERALREIYLPAFEAAVKEADPLTVMGSYNKINGTYACANKHLLIDILKNEWGFKGFVVSDWGAVYTTLESANGGCDLEMPGPGTFMTSSKLYPAVKDGRVSEQIINDKARRLVRAMFRLGLFEETPGQKQPAADYAASARLAREVAENSIVLLKNANSILPLKKDGIKSIAVIGPNAAVMPVGGGGSSTINPKYMISVLDGIKNKLGDKVKVEYAEGSNNVGGITDIPLEFITAGDSSERGFKAEYFNNKDLSGSPVLTKIEKSINYSWSNKPLDPKVPNDNFSARWTAVIAPRETKEYYFGTTSDDGSRVFIDDKLVVDNWYDHAPMNVIKPARLEAGRKYRLRVEYYESSGEASMIFGWIPPDSILQRAIDLAKRSDTVILCMGLSPFFESEGKDRDSFALLEAQDKLIEEVAKVNKNTVLVLINGTPVQMDKWLDKVSGVIEALYPGQEGGNAVADVLFGDVNPSGKLPVTFPKQLDDVARYTPFPGENDRIEYKEGIFVGYRLFDKYKIEPLFPFGHGLSYTTFEYSNMEVKPIAGSDNLCSVSIDVANTGQRDGKEVVQLYVSDVQSSVERPVRELKRFEKITLKPGEKKKVIFTLDKRAFAYYSVEKKDWVVEPGVFEIQVGSSSRDIRSAKRISL